MIYREKNIISSGDRLEYSNLLFFISQIYQAINQYQYRDIVIDFSQVKSAFADTIVPICADILRYKNQGIEFSCILPDDDKMKKLFINANWAHIIDNKYIESVFSGYTQYPATLVYDDDSLSECVNSLIDCILRATKIENRNDLHIIEWSLNEIIENIIRHAGDEAIGIVHLSKFFKNKKCVEVVIADNGIGIPKSFKNAGLFLEDNDITIIRESINEGITNGSGMGNGLYGSSEIAVKSGGYFKICSQYGSISYDNKVLHQKATRIPYHGTTICIALDFTIPGTLENALMIKGKIHRPASVYTEVLYDDTNLTFDISKEVPSCNTRNVASPFRNKVLNMYYIQSPQYVIFNCKNIGIMTSSFADELFGKILLDIGIDDFNRKIKISELSDKNKIIVDRAIQQRL